MFAFVLNSGFRINSLFIEMAIIVIVPYKQLTLLMVEPKNYLCSYSVVRAT